MSEQALFFDPNEVKIFEYYNGEQLVAVDPYDVMLKIASFDDFDWEAAFGTFLKHEMDLEAGVENIKEAGEAARMTMGLIDKLRGVFNIEPLHRTGEGTYVGLGGSQVLKVLMDWHEFLSTLKKTEEDTPTSAPNTEPAGWVENSLTPNG
jgi:hypothetical protein